jgi:hypothetical protein
MAIWLPALKMVLPYVASVATTAIPAFTQRREGDKSIELMAQQISELQQAAGDNAESVKLLADQMQKALQVIELAAETNERRFRRVQLLSVLSLGVALSSLLLVLLLLLR